MIYFIRDGNYTKISYIPDEPDRLRKHMDTLQAANPRPLSLIALNQDGGPRAEAALHEALRPWCVGGDWFEYGPVLEKVLKQANATPAKLVTETTKIVGRSQTFRKRKHGNVRMPAIERTWEDLTGHSATPKVQE